ncbi:MAG: 6-phosphogluconolactonase [Candidatus Falkowbacteria bacterium]
MANTTKTVRNLSLELIVASDYEKMSQLATKKIFKEIKLNPKLLISLATGSTPTRAYDLLAEKSKKEPKIFNKVRMIGLDEWGGVPNNDPCTCLEYIMEHLTGPMNIPTKRFTSWDSDPQDPAKEVERVTKALEKEGDIDVCILGMGVNGHLGFNEPTDSLKLKPHIAELTDTTKKHTMAQEAEHEIKYGLTLGMGEIMRSKKVILLVNGAHKVEPFKIFLSQKISAQFPASILWLHPNVTVFCDEDAVPEMPIKI